MMYHRNESSVGTQQGVKAFMNIRLVQTDHWAAHTAHLQAESTRLSQTARPATGSLESGFKIRVGLLMRGGGGVPAVRKV